MMWQDPDSETDNEESSIVKEFNVQFLDEEISESDRDLIQTSNSPTLLQC